MWLGQDSWWTHLVHGCIAQERALFWRRSPKETMACTIRFHRIFCTDLCLCLDPSPEKEESENKIHPNILCVKHGRHGDPMIYAIYEGAMEILAIQLTLLVHIKIASFNSSSPSVVSTITCTTAHSIYILCHHLASYSTFSIYSHTKY